MGSEGPPLTERTRVSLTTAAMIAVVAAGAGLVQAGQLLREQAVTQARVERDRVLAGYVTRLELLEARQQDAERIRARMDGLSNEVRAGFARVELRLEQLRRR